MIPGQLAMAVFFVQINAVNRPAALIIHKEDAFSWNERGQPARTPLKIADPSIPFVDSEDGELCRDASPPPGFCVDEDDDGYCSSGPIVSELVFGSDRSQAFDVPDVRSEQPSGCRSGCGAACY